MIVDLHVHSKYSRATSKDMDLEHLYLWGKIKGINVIPTGDFTHPLWFKELQEKLEPAEPGLFKLKTELAAQVDHEVPASCRDNSLRFMLSSEISNIYSKNEKVRKLHNVILAPSFESVSKINTSLDKIGNLQADGRPILGLDSKNLLEVSLKADENNFFIPAHIWTPWFAMFGSKSGFDSIKEAFDDLAPYIRAVETGLSSDPFMNWRLSQLDGLTLVSNSDAHSPKKLGREANLIDCDLDYYQIIDALKSNDQRMIGTIEFFPQEGKYHYDGHRNCGICFTPEESIKHNLLCPKCSKPLVLGVDYRVTQIADRPADYQPKQHKKVEYIIPLAEILAEIEGVKSVASKKVVSLYQQLIKQFGHEFYLLRQANLEALSQAGFNKLATALQRMRAGKIKIEPGYDGVYGKIKVFNGAEELKKLDGQLSLGI